jgi:hypothetical protein
MADNIELKVRYNTITKTIRTELTKMKRGPKRKKIEIEVSHLVRKIERYNIPDNSCMLEYVANEIEELESVLDKYS